MKKLYQAVIDGTPPYTHIIAEMRELGVKGRRGRYLTPGNVSAMLKLPIYAGIYEARAGDATSRIENNHPAIVSKETYEEAIRIMEARLNTGRRPKNAYQCTGLVRCGICGAVVYGHTAHKGGKEYRSYICSKSCGLRSIRAPELDQAARDYVAALLRPQVREQLKAALTAYLDGQREQARLRVPGVRREIARLQQQIEAIVTNMSAGVLPASVLERMGRQVTDLESQISVLESMITEPPQLPPSMIDRYFDDVASLDEDTDIDLARQILRRFISSITIHPTALEFECTFDKWLRTYFPSLHPGDPDALAAAAAERSAVGASSRGASASLFAVCGDGDDPEGVEISAQAADSADDPDPDGPGGTRRPSRKNNASSNSSSGTTLTPPDSPNHMPQVSGTAQRTAHHPAELWPRPRRRRLRRLRHAKLPAQHADRV